MPEAVLNVVPDPIALFRQWLDEATRHEPNDPNAMALATTGRDGRPSVRMVLLKEIDDQGFVFYTNKQSRKADQIEASRSAGLLFHWKSLRRQVRVEGPVGDVDDADADAYFRSRARISRLGAIASDQSRPSAGSRRAGEKACGGRSSSSWRRGATSGALVRLPGVARTDRVLAGHATPPARPDGISSPGRKRLAGHTALSMIRITWRPGA